MKQYWNAFVMCQSMFCSIPCPWKNWDEKARPHMLLFLPLVGLEIGLLWTVLAFVMNWLPLPQLVSGAVLCLYPFFVTGFIHLDGFMDVTDAVKSWRDLERRREILKDSRVGAFAVISCGALMIMQFACAATIEGYFGFLLIPVVSRCCSGLAVTVLPAMSTSQYANKAENKVGHIAFYIILMAAAIAAAFLLDGKSGVAVIGCIAGYGLALLRAYRSLKGMNGDISGYALTIGELCGLIVLALI